MGSANYESFVSVLDLIWQRRYYEKPLIHFYKQSQCYESWTYGQLWQASQRIAQGLSDLPNETPVFISLPNGPEFLATFFACLMNGLWPAPIVSPEIWNRQEYLDYIQKISERTGIRNIVTTSGASKDLVERDQTVHTFEKLWNLGANVASYEMPSRASLKNQIALLQFSSGSTAESKGVLLTHERILKNLEQISHGMATQMSDSMATWLPLYHDMGLIGGFLGPLFHQVPVHISSPIDFVMDPLAWLSHVSKVHASVIVGPDFMYKLLARKARANKFTSDLSSLRICMTGSEPVMASTCRDFVEAFAPAQLNPHALMPVYGMAEAVLGVTFAKPMNALKVQQISQTPTEWVSCGKPLSGIQIEIRDSQGHVLPEKTIGEIYISSPSLVIGFYKRPDLDSELLQNGWLKTGDTGFLSSGELYITGRTKDLVIVRGRKIHTVDLETKIYEKWKNQISRVALVAASNSADNNSLIAAIELRSWLKRNLQYEEVSNFLKSQWPDLDFQIYLLPKKSLPRTSSGKLKRYQIRELAQSGQLKALSKTSVLFILGQGLERLKLAVQIMRSHRGKKPHLQTEESDLLKQEIEKTFCKTVGLQTPASFEKSFHEMGLDSIKMIELLTEVEARFGEIPLDKFYQFKNLNDVYDFLKAEHSLKRDTRPFVSQTSV